MNQPLWVPNPLSPQEPKPSTMTPHLAELIAGYVGVETERAQAFLGVARLCGYELVLTHSYRQPAKPQALRR